MGPTGINEGGSARHSVSDAVARGECSRVYKVSA